MQRPIPRIEHRHSGGDKLYYIGSHRNMVGQCDEGKLILFQ